MKLNQVPPLTKEDIIKFNKSMLTSKGNYTFKGEHLSVEEVFEALDLKPQTK